MRLPPRLQLLFGGLGPAVTASALAARAASRHGVTPAASAPAAASVGVVAGAAGAAAYLAWDGRRRFARLERVVDRSDARTARRTDAVIARVGRAVAEQADRTAEAVRLTEGRLATLIDAKDRTAASRSEELPERTLALLEPLVGLTALLRPRAPLPSMTGFAAAGDLLLAYVGEILRRRPGLVVECGSGVSTLVAAYALELVGADGRVVALEDGERWVERTSGFLADHGLEHRAEVRHAPIVDVAVGGGSQPWYSLDALKGLDGIGVLLVDGPVGSLAPMARYPAVPLLRDRMAPNAAVMLDDVGRDEEDRIAHRWAQEWPELSQTRLRHRKGTAVFTTPGEGVTPAA